MSPHGRLASCLKLRRPHSFALRAARPSFPVMEPRAPKPQPSTTDTRVAIANPANIMAGGITWATGQIVGPSSQSHKAHVHLSPCSTTSLCVPYRNLPRVLQCCPAALPGTLSKPDAPPRAAAVCRARCRPARLLSALHWLSTCLVCVSEAHNVSTMLCSLARAPEGQSF